MTETKRKAYQKAYTELNEIFNAMPEEQLNKIPKFFIANVQKEMDTEYTFKLENNKELMEQNIMTETKALLVQIYEDFLAEENEKEIWKKYNRFCTDKIEERKREQYNPDDLFRKKQVLRDGSAEESMAMVEYKKENIFTRIISKIKRLFFR